MPASLQRASELSVLPRRPPPRIDRSALARWLALPRVQRQLRLSEAALAARLPEVFGRECLQIGGFGEGDFLAQAATVHRAVLAAPQTPGAAAWIEPEALPLPARCVDAVVLPHTLEFCRSPHQVLREVDRVLSDRGRLFILGFNPWSPWVLRWRLGLVSPGLPLPARFSGVGRLEDWLTLLDYEITEVHRFSPGFPWMAAHSDGGGPLTRRLLQPLQEVFLLSARKRILPMNRLPRPERAQVRPLIGMPVARRERTDDVPSPPSP
jgi:SAM-dependent methyltransferase